METQVSYPDPPEHVRAHTRTGKVIPLECTYEGFDERSRMHVWRVVRELDRAEVRHISVAVLPPRTSVVVDWI